MPDDQYSSRLRPARQSGGALRFMLGSAFLAFIAGAALIGWLIWDGKLVLPTLDSTRTVTRTGTAPANAPATTADTAEQARLEQQVGTLQQRLARIDLQAAAAEGNTARAEALLVALATRRAIDRGLPLGYLEEQLHLRFGAARPDAVGAVIAAARTPVTLASLSAELDRLEPELAGTRPEDNAWSRFHQQVSGLFVVHRTAPQANTPQNRIALARLQLGAGQLDAAAETITGLSRGKAAADWAARARGLATAQAALDQIEQAALAEPEKLKTGTGETVRQPGPAASPTPQAPAEANF